MFLIVGLGNPGKSYSNNRHNIGFKVLEKLEDTYNIPKFTKKFKSNFSKFVFNEKLLLLLKMNVEKLDLNFLVNLGIL